MKILFYSDVTFCDSISLFPHKIDRHDAGYRLFSYKITGSLGVLNKNVKSKMNKTV